MPSTMNFHGKRLSMHNKKLACGGGLVRHLARTADTLADRTQTLARAAEKHADNTLRFVTDTATDAVDHLQKATTKKLQQFKKKKARNIAESGPEFGPQTAPLTSGNLQALNDLTSRRPRYLAEEKKKGNIKFSID